MKIQFLIKKTLFVKLLILCFICSQLLFLSPSYAQKDWKFHVKDLVSQLVKNQKPGAHVYVPSLRDESNRQVYYPFMETVSKVMANEFTNNGFIASPTPVNADSYVMTTFLESPDRLFLNASLISAEDGSTALASATVEIPDNSLPKHWRKRSLRDVAYELVGKLEQKLFDQRAEIVFGEFSGGHKKEDAYISDFSATMRGYIKEEMIKSGTFVILVPSEQQSGNAGVGRLTGNYLAAGNDIIFRLILQKGQQRQREIANVSSKFSTQSVPQGMHLFPQNIHIASQNTDYKDDTAGYSTGVPIRVWTNKTSGIYRKNDKLVIYLQPDQDCYVRVYYIQSDGAVVQTFPSDAHESGFLKRGLLYGVGGKEDDVELVITDETVGQEFIKVFASTRPINDSSVPKEFIQGANVFRIPGGYRGLQRSLARGLNISKKKLLPAAEVKILVK